MAEAMILLQMGQIEEMLLMKTTTEEVNKCASKSGEYHALGEIGKGAFGTVFRAINKDGQEVAIKICKTDVGLMQVLLHGVRSSDLLQQALKEAQCLSEMSHPYVLQLLDVYDFTSQRGGKGIALVTEYCAKGNLQQYLEKYRPGEEKRFKWCHQLAEAMKYIHSKGIAHRDIKPANILIDSEDNMKIGDVGVAKAAWDFGAGLKGIKNRDVAFGMYMETKAGTPAYMAPEVMDQRYTEESDIFSLGLVFVMIVESPNDLIPFAVYRGESKLLGQLLHDCPAARSCRPIDLLELEIRCAPKSEVNLFNHMLEFSYHKRPTAAEVVEQIKDMNRARGIQLIMAAALLQAIAERESRPRKKIKCSC